MIETAINTIVSTPLAALTPAVPFYWGIVPSNVDEYVSLSGVYDSLNQDDDGSDDKQFNIVTRSGMVRAREIDAKLKYELQRYKGNVGGVKIFSITHTRGVELPNADTGESIIAAEYHFNYEGGL